MNRYLYRGIKTMKIIRVLNTNAVVTLDESNREVIVTGPGIGFKKKKGEHFDPALAEKKYCLENKEDNQRLQNVVSEISERYLEIAARIVESARKEQKLKVRDTLYVTLTDHIHSSVERYQNGMALKNMMKHEIRKFYPQEYTTGTQGIQWVLEETGFDLGDDEAAFIAMHIISAEFEANECSDVPKIAGLINAILKIIKLHFKIDPDEDSVSYQRFITHLKFFSTRILANKLYKDSMKELYQVLVEQNEYAYTGVKKVARFIEQKYDYKLSIDEELYLLIHIKRILDEQ